MGAENKQMENKPEVNRDIIKRIDQLKNIKSPFILKRIFINLDENIKLNMIKYNKKYQKLFGLNIKYFKERSGRYISFNTTPLNFCLSTISIQ